MRKLIDDQRGSTIVEFAIVAPVLLMLILGGLELGYTAYVKAVLEGEMQKVSRDRTLESSGSDAQRVLIESRVREAVRQLAPRADVTFTRKAYRDYSNVVATHEEFNDANNNGKCDANEVYLDANNSGKWDIDAGTVGSDGAAKDVVIYTAIVDYSRLPLGGFLSWGDAAQLTAKTALRNQPFDKQTPIVERSCA